MISRPPSLRWLNPLKPEPGEIKRIDERVDYSNRIVPWIQSSRHSGNSVDWPRSAPSTKRFIRSPATPMDHNIRGVFTQPGSFLAVQAAERHGRSTSLSGPTEPERGDLAIRHRRGANVFDALGSISGPAGKRPSYRQIVRCRLSNSMLGSGPTTPQDYQE
jgi:hypothetical protein